MRKIPFIIFVFATVVFSYIGCFTNGQISKNFVSASFISIVFSIASFALAFLPEDFLK